MSWMLLTRTICCTSRIAGIHSEKMNFLKIEKWWQYIFTVLGKRRVKSVFSVVSKSLAKLGPWHSYHLRIGSIGCVETRWPVISWLFFGWRWWYWWWGWGTCLWWQWWLGGWGWGQPGVEHLVQAGHTSVDLRTQSLAAKTSLETKTTATMLIYPSRCWCLTQGKRRKS